MAESEKPEQSRNNNNSIPLWHRMKYFSLNSKFVSMQAKLKQNGVTVAMRVIQLHLIKINQFIVMSTFRNIYVTFKVTLKCNLACQYCYGRDNHAQGSEMSDEEIQRGIQFVCRIFSFIVCHYLPFKKTKRSCREF